MGDIFHITWSKSKALSSNNGAMSRKVCEVLFVLSLRGTKAVYSFSLLKTLNFPFFHRREMAGVTEKWSVDQVRI